MMEVIPSFPDKYGCVYCFQKYIAYIELADHNARDINTSTSYIYTPRKQGFVKKWDLCYCV